MMAVPWISKRFAMERFLGLTREEIAQNESQWKEENVNDEDILNASGELRSAGITANNMSGDISSLSSPPPPPEGEEGAAPGGAAPEGGAPAVPPPAA
jgi:hypothetical protein